MTRPNVNRAPTCCGAHWNLIFVFGSNLSGIHGAGAAAHALLAHGAVMGIGRGPTGHSYALPTKDEHIQTLPLSTIELYVKEFLTYARENPIMTFLVTRIGCGLAGYTNDQIAPMFRGAPSNCKFDPEWEPYLSSEKENNHVHEGP
jgi:hypothetical protein